MQCPKCRCEVGNQQICPYCGATVFLQESLPYGRYPSYKAADNTKGESMQYKADRMETKINLILIFSIASFVLSVVSLVVLATQ